MLSDDTATTDRVVKLIDYAQVPSLRCYVLPEQTAVNADPMVPGLPAHKPTAP